MFTGVFSASQECLGHFAFKAGASASDGPTSGSISIGRSTSAWGLVLTKATSVFAGCLGCLLLSSQDVEDLDV